MLWGLRNAYLSCFWCFPSDPNTSHSNLFIASSRMLARPLTLQGPAGRDNFLKGCPDSAPRTVQTFSRTPPAGSSLPGAFHTRGSHTSEFTSITCRSPRLLHRTISGSPSPLIPWRLEWALLPPPNSVLFIHVNESGGDKNNHLPFARKAEHTTHR